MGSDKDADDDCAPPRDAERAPICSGGRGTIQFGAAMVHLCAGAGLVDGGGFRQGSLCVMRIHCFFVSA